MIDNILNEKYEKLKDYIESYQGAIVAFSSGVDSSFLLKAAHDILKDNVIAVTVTSPFFPKRETEEAVEFCRQNNIRHQLFEIKLTDIEGFAENPPNRCYLCKKILFSKIKSIADKNNITDVFEGSNIDDDNDYRPGMAAVKELGVKSPLKYAGLSKDEIRILSKELNLPTFDKPSFACLASRFVYGEIITEDKLLMVEKAEQMLIDLGFRQVRVRLHNLLARIEVCEDDFSKFFQKEIREKTVRELKKLGFKYISLDLEGYRTGSMNRTISPNNK